MAWNGVAKKFETALPKEANVLISNATLKKSKWEKWPIYAGQSTYEIHITERTKITILND